MVRSLRAALRLKRKTVVVMGLVARMAAGGSVMVGAARRDVLGLSWGVGGAARAWFGWLSARRTRRARAPDMRGAADAISGKAPLLWAQSCAALAHDLRQPIAAAKLILWDARASAQDEGALRALQRLDQTMELMATMVEHVLRCTQSNAGALDSRWRVTNVAEVLERVFGEMEVLALQRRVDFRLRCSDQYIVSDAAILYRIVQNLVSNALACVHDGGVLLSVRTRGPDDILVQIFDTGPGMSEQHVKRLTGSEQPVGARRAAGLGLDIVNDFCAALGIRVQVKTVSNQGSVVSLRMRKTRRVAPWRASEGGGVESAQASAASPSAASPLVTNFKAMLIKSTTHGCHAL
ncbi:integral membrane sensor hybrid histidine kinase [Caballeronia calidae]|uniref:histidine kinase n=1 Tax=Caballeronia calidae TaxID=1777139 RepID=A0A158EHB8_9BURK|nr:HAMP domain-containing sensor histidine kinase [Caballeronia calidae]SAL06282.1 integral membrane sensor hybrid histidine kinase [Caballeronia calidae]